jgi:hypothetical protein
LVALTAVLAVSAVGASAAAAETARPADSMVDSIGVATHTTYNDTVYYQRFSELKEKLAKLGVRHIREDLMPNRPDQYQRLNELAGMGVGATLIMGSPSVPTGTLENLLGVVRTKLNRVDAVEGPNEYYLSGKADWTSLARDYQQRLFEGINSNPSTASIPVLGPSTIFWQAGELGDISQWLDYGTIHPYPGPYPSEEYLARHMDFAARSSASKPLMATETGYHNAINHTGGHVPVPEATSAVYLPRLFLDNFSRGVRRTFSYELVDSFPNAANDDCESHFGLLRNDLSEKPAFTSLKNLIGILSDPGPAFQANDLDLTVGGERSNLRRVLLQKRDGTYYLALWRTSRVWNPDQRVEISPATSAVTVSAPGLRGAQLLAVNRSASAQKTLAGSSSEVRVDVGAEVVILQLDLGNSAGAPSVSPAEEVIPPPVVPSDPAPAPAPAPVQPAPKAAEDGGAKPAESGSSQNGGRRQGRPRTKARAPKHVVRGGGRSAVRGRIAAGD